MLAWISAATAPWVATAVSAGVVRDKGASIWLMVAICAINAKVCQVIICDKRKVLWRQHES